MTNNRAISTFSTESSPETDIRCSIIVPAGDDLSMLNNFLFFLNRAQLPCDYEIVIVNDRGLYIDEKLLGGCSLPVKILNLDTHLSQEQLFNKSAVAARGNFLLFVRKFINLDELVLEEAIRALDTSGDKISVSANGNFLLAESSFFMSNEIIMQIIKETDENTPLDQIVGLLQASRLAAQWTPQDQRMLDFYSQFISPGDVCFDVGANIGNRTKVFLKLGSKVVAVEPQGDCVRCLKVTYGRNDNFRIIQKALGESQGRAELMVCNANTISSMSREWIDSVKKSGRFRNYSWDKTQTVLMTTLDKLVEEYGIPAFTKIDVEGFEYEVLKGLSQPLKALSLEFAPEFIASTFKCIEHLQSLGRIQLNYSLGETMRLVLDKWINPKEMIETLKNFGYDNKSFGEESFGDVYVKFLNAVPAAFISCDVNRAAGDRGSRLSIIKDNTDLLRQLQDIGLYRENGPLKLHLGCGDRRLQGYINIDYPPSEHHVQVSSGADVFGDVTKFLPAQTTQEAELVEGLRKSFAALPEIECRDAFPSEAKWTSHMNRLRELVLNDDPRRFLCWDMIKGTMFVGSDSYVKIELDYLKTLPDWDTRWREAINESSIGHPLPYPSYPSSSGNLITHAYHLAQFEEKTKTRVNEMDYIFEFGGGYGSMCRLFHNLCFHGKYVIFDLPYFSELQRFYLGLLGMRIHTIDTFAETNKGVICISDFERLKEILLREFKECNTMFVATWSISETPINLRNLVLPLAADCKTFLIGYQHQFEEVNNLEFFSKWKESLNSDITWHNWQIEHIPGNSYLIGKQSDRLLKADKITGKEREKLDEIVSSACQGQTQKTGLQKAPTVSIFMSVLNGEKYLSQTIESILTQTYGDFELIIVDDGSSDGTVDVAKSYQSRDARVKVISAPHKGVVDARNKAIEHTNPHSKYLLNHDGDDISLPEKLEKLVRYLDEHPQVAIVGCFAEYFDDEGNNRGQPPIEWQVERIRQTFGQVNSMIHSASLIRRQVLDKIGCYREDYVFAEDYDLFARALLAGFNLANIPEVLHKIRLHPASVGSVHAEQMKVSAEKISQYYLAEQQKQETLPDEGPDMSKRPRVFDDSLKILHTVEFYHPHFGGSEEVIKQISERLVLRGHDVTVATMKLPERTFNELNGVKIEEFDVNGSLVRGFKGSDIGRYREYLLKHPADVVMNFGAQQWATDIAFESLNSTHDRRVNIISPCGYSALQDACTLRDSRFKDYFTRVIPMYLPKYDAAVYNSTNYQDYQYAQNHNFTNSLIIPNGACEQEFLQEPKVDFRGRYGIATKYFGLCVANFYGEKGQERVIECVRQMKRSDITMVFIGTHGGDLPNLRRLACGLNVKFLVGLDRQNVLAAYRQADIFLFGSHKECSPLVILEAKASRLPFVSTDCGNVRELTGGVVCLPEKMACYANRILDDDELRKTLAEEGFRQWKEKFTWDSIVNRYEELYLSLHQKKTGTGVGRKRFVSYAGGPERQKQTETGITALIFSKDRAMQLQATVESFILQCRDNDAADIVVLFKTSGAVHQKQYDELKKSFPAVTFVEETDFRQQVLSVVERCKYVLFLVDDNIFVKPFSLRDIVAALDSEKKAIGFSLRLGKNTHYCYMLNSPQKLPAFHRVQRGILGYCWPGAEGSFGNSLEVSSSVYRANEILCLLRRLEFSNPNTLESAMSQNRQVFILTAPVLLTFEESVTFCNPVNIVQSTYKSNKFGTVHKFPYEQLADFFSRGMAIDVQKYAGLTPNSEHQEVELYFKPADRVISEAQAVRTDCEHQAKTSKPKFSIVMANYNNSRFIVQAIESVLSQTFKEWELIIVDDCSTDDSVDIIKRYLTDDRIRLIRHDINNGYITALKTGIAAVNSELFGILDSDDSMAVHAVETMYKHHMQSPDCGFIYSHFMWCDANLRPVHGGFCCEIPPGVTALDMDAVSHFKTFKLRDYLKTSGYDESMLYAEDKDIIYKMEEVTRLKFVPDCLYYYRELPLSQSHDARKANIGRKSKERAKSAARKRRGQDIHSLYERYVLGKSQGNPYLSDIPLYQAQDNPLVSIWMAVYNGADYIARSIESVMIQNYRNFELIVVDDGSTDQSAAIVRSFKDESIKYFWKEHGGLASARNVQLKKSAGSFIIILDSDDMMTPDFLARHLQTFEQHPEADLVYCDDYLIDDEDDHIRILSRPEYKNQIQLIYDTFRFGFPVVPFRTCIRKDVFNKIGHYDERLIIGEDYDMMRRFIKQGLRMHRLPEALYLRRLGENSHSRNFNAAKARSQFEAIRRFTETFTPEQLFPDVRWCRLSDKEKVLMAKYRTALVYIRIGNQYLKAKAQDYALRAYDMAYAEMDDCCQIAPKFQLFTDLREKCESICTMRLQPDRRFVRQPVLISDFNMRGRIKQDVISLDNKKEQFLRVRSEDTSYKIAANEQESGQ